MIGTLTEGRVSLIKTFLKADTAEGLVRLQLQTNVAVRGQAHFTDIQFVDGFWYAWFTVDIDRFPEFIKVLNGTLTNTG